MGIGDDVRKIEIHYACENIDAGLFSSDTFHNKDDLCELKKYLRRWDHEVKNIEEMLKEDNEI